MGKYDQMREAAGKNRKTTKINPTYVEFKKEGRMVLGEFVSTSTIIGSEDKEYLQYLFLTDAGPVKFHCGAVFDGEVMPLMEPGQVYEVIFEGQEEIKGGRRVNKFTVNHIPVSFGEEEEPEPEPEEKKSKGKK